MLRCATDTDGCGTPRVAAIADAVSLRTSVAANTPAVTLVERFAGSSCPGNRFICPAKFAIYPRLLHHCEIRKQLVRRRTQHIFVDVRESVADGVRNKNIR